MEVLHPHRIGISSRDVGFCGEGKTGVKPHRAEKRQPTNGLDLGTEHGAALVTGQCYHH